VLQEVAKFRQTFIAGFKIQPMAIADAEQVPMFDTLELMKVKNVIKMLVEVELYTETFETSLLQNTESFYAEQS